MAGVNADRALKRIEGKAQDRAKLIAEFIVAHIKRFGPRDELHAMHTEGPHLADSYYVELDEATGSYVILSSQPYWVYVEFGTRRVPGREDRRPHVRPAIDAAEAAFK